MSITNIKYSEILKHNAQLGKMLTGEGYSIAVLSNIITYQLNDVLEYILRIENIPAQVQSGDYDNIVQDSLKYQNSDLVLIYWEACNIIDGLHYQRC